MKLSAIFEDEILDKFIDDMPLMIGATANETTMFTQAMPIRSVNVLRMIVRRHFAEQGRDPYAQPFTCVGVGDMGGDVFGNGMLLSKAIKLTAAFDHRHIFIDPDPV